MIPLSVLDLAMVPDGASSGEALRQTTEFARAAERAGYTRIWVAEHHNMATVASTTPGVLMAHLAASTETIKVGSGGVMLPNHAPLAIAEQFALLEAMHPGRIDLGVGRAPGTDGATGSRYQGAKNSAFGMALTSLDKFGVPPCHARTSRISTLPAGAGQTVESFIQAGSSSRLGIGAWLCCVPGICRTGPFSQLKSTVRKLQQT